MATQRSKSANQPTARSGIASDVLLCIAVFLASAMCIITSFKVLGPARGLISVWPLTAVELAFCLHGRRDTRRSLANQIFPSSGVVTGGLVSHLHWPMITVVLVLSQLEVFISYRLMRSAIAGFDDLREARGMVRFAIVSVACPASIAVLAAAPLAIITHHSLWTLTVASAVADSLGYLTVLPLVLFCFSGPVRQIRLARPNLKLAAPAVLLFLATASFVFWQTENPVLFLIFPPLLFVVFTLGLEGAVTATAALAFIGSLATKFDHGPLTLSQSSQKNHALFLLQAFLWIVSLTALPVGSLLGEQRRARRRAHEAELIYKTLLHNTDDVIVLSSLDGSQRYISPAITKLAGWTPDEFLVQERFTTIHPEEQELARGVVESICNGKNDRTFRYRLKRKDGDWLWVEAAVHAYKDFDGKSVQGYVATVRDISERRSQEHAWNAELSTLAHQNQVLAVAASTDRLTGLINRRGLDEALREMKHGSRISLLLLDVDHFKNYNDHYGHLAGDDCLRQLADVLRDASADLPYCTTARFGGEEFAILLHDAEHDDSYFVASDILHALNTRRIPHEASPRGFVTMSVGISTWTHDGEEDIAQMIHLADKALYESKRGGRNRITCADEVPASGVHAAVA